MKTKLMLASILMLMVGCASPERWNGRVCGPPRAPQHSVVPAFYPYPMGRYDQKVELYRLPSGDMARFIPGSMPNGEYLGHQWTNLKSIN